MGPFEIVFYKRQDGSRPAEDFILSQSDKMQAKLYAALMYLEVKGPELRAKPLGDGIFEIRANQQRREEDAHDFSGRNSR